MLEVDPIHVEQATTHVGQNEAVAPHFGQPQAIVGRTNGLARTADKLAEGEINLPPAGEVVHKTCLKPLGRVGRLIDAHIIHQCVLREGHAIINRPTEVAADGRIEEQEEGMVEYPLIRRHIGGDGLVVFHIIHVPDDAVGHPFHPIGLVALAGDGIGEGEGVPKRCATRVAGAMNRTEDLVG